MLAIGTRRRITEEARQEWHRETEVRFMHHCARSIFNLGSSSDQ
jgi:hypothetical protein